ncbi:MAG: DUF2316 family protein [Arachnia sp.]
MSLNDAQRRATASEFARNLELAGLTRDELRERCGLTPSSFALAMDVRPGCDPVDVWLIRDTLETAVKEAGGTPVPFSAMPERMRAAAGRWFGVTDRR